MFHYSNVSYITKFKAIISTTISLPIILQKPLYIIIYYSTVSYTAQSKANISTTIIFPINPTEQIHRNLFITWFIKVYSME